MTDKRTAAEQAADVIAYRTRQAQAARENREQLAITVDGCNTTAGSRVRPGIAHATRQARKQRGEQAGRELQKRRWVETQLGGPR